MLKHLRSCALLGLLAVPAVAAAGATTYLGPVAVIASKDGGRLFVANSDARQMAVVDAASGKLLKAIPMPAEPSGLVLSPDGKLVYVTCAAPHSTVCLIEAASGRLVGSIAAGHTAVGPAVSPDGKRLYVCNRFNNNVSVIDLTNRRELARVRAGREPIAAGVTPDGKTVFVASHLPLDEADSGDVAATVTVIDLASLKTESIRLPNGSTGVRGLCVSPDGRHVFITHILARYQLPVTQPDRGWINTNALSILDAQTCSLVNSVLLDDVDLGAANPWGIGTTADGKTIVVSHSGTHELSVIDVKGLFDKLTRTAATPGTTDVSSDLSFLVDLRQRIELEGNGPRGLAVAGAKVYVAEYFSDTLGVIDLAARVARRERQIALGPTPHLTQSRRGEMIFHNADICFQHWQSCASCHPDARSDGLNWDLTNDGVGNPKNTRSMLLVHQGGPAMSMGVRASAEDAVRAGFLRSLFAVRTEEEAAAVDDYLRSLRPVPSPYLVDGHLSPAAERGKKVFFDPNVGCARCHPEPLYFDKRLHNVRSQGRFDRPFDRFTTPRLIEVWRTAPYMHDGRYLTLKDLMVKGRHGLDRPGDANLSDMELDDLVEFMLSL
jgi:YVTN family beta-propeller protein